MSDEQTIYISPDDDLTTVRERLEHIQTRKVIMVVPAQTQLRSHVAWKLLFARVRELGKDVLIVSSDPQVRSVAHAVKFTVANSLESSQQGHSRPVGRPTRSGPTNRTKVAGPGPRSAPARPASATRSTNSLRPKPTEVRSWQGAEPKIDSQVRERRRTGYREPVASQDEVIDDLDPATFHSPEKKGKSFDFRVNSAPPIQPLTPGPIEEPDLLLEDYTQAQDIRSAANDLPSQPDALPVTPRTSPEVTRRPSQTQASKASQIPLNEDDEDPFSYMEDKQFSQSGEQHGNTPIGYDDHNYEHVIRDVSDEPTSIVSNHFEYNQIPEANKNTRKRDQRPPDTGTKKREMPRPPQRLSGNIAPAPPAASIPSFPTAQRMRSEDLDDDDLLPEERPVEERPTRIQTRDRLNEARPQRPVRARESVPLAPTGPRKQGPGLYSGQLNRPGVAQQPQSQQRPITNRNVDASRQQPVRRTQTNGRPEPHVIASRQRKTAPPITRQQRRNNNIPIWISTAVAIILILTIFICIYAIPTATATITVATRDYSHAISLTANTSGQSGAVPAQQFTQDFSKQGTETATGKKMVGIGKATGEVCFGNTGTTSVTIPTGSIVTTASGVQFVTTAEGVIQQQITCTNSPPIPVQAVQAGQTGNIGPGVITLIPNTSLEAIATSNTTTAAKLKLSVNNLAAITGGGIQPVPAVTTQDLVNAKADLHKQVQTQIDTWKKGLPEDGVLGTLTTTDTLTNAPKVGDTINAGKTFPVGVQVKATILFVKNADIKSAAATQLGTTIKTDKNFTNDVLLPQTVTITKLKQQETNNTSMKLNFTAATKVTGQFDENTIRSSIAGQSTGAAQDTLKKQSSSVQNVAIKVNPAFFSWVPWYQPHIAIKIIAGTNVTK
jgi:Baseplate J-like protein